MQVGWLSHIKQGNSRFCVTQQYNHILLGPREYITESMDYFLSC